jgi:hypothetical protein
LTRFGDAGGDGVRTERAKCNGQQAQEAGDDNKGRPHERD